MYEDEDLGFTPYHALENLLLETAYRKDEKFVDFTEDSDDGLVRVDFQKMMEYRLDSPGRTKRIERNALGGLLELHVHVRLLYLFTPAHQYFRGEHEAAF